MRVEHKRDDVGAPGAQALGRAVGQITDFVCNLLDLLPGLQRNLRRSAERPRNGGHGQSGKFRDRAERRLDCRVFARFALSASF